MSAGVSTAAIGWPTIAGQRGVIGYLWKERRPRVPSRARRDGWSDIGLPLCVSGRIGQIVGMQGGTGALRQPSKCFENQRLEEENRMLAHVAAPLIDQQPALKVLRRFKAALHTDIESHVLRAEILGDPVHRCL